MSQVDQMLEVYGASQLDASFGVSVVFGRGALRSAAFTATWEAVDYEVPDENGYPTKITHRDFRFPIGAADVGSGPIEPRSGDQLFVTENEVDTVFEILPIGRRPAAELLAGGYRWLVHTKRVP